MTAPERMHRVHSLARRDVPPEARTRTRWMLGMNVRELTLWACDTLRPKIVVLPQFSHTLAMTHLHASDRK